MTVDNRESPSVPLSHHLTAVAVLLVYCCALNWQYFAGGMPYRDDVAKETIPQMQQYAQGLREGRIPLWNNNLGCGYYQHGSGETAMYYPPNLLIYRLFHWATAYRISLVLHTFAACVWLYLFGLAVGLRVLPSLLLAMCVGAGGTMAAHQIHLNVVLGLSLGFFTLWLASQWSRSDGSPLWVLGGAVGAGLAMLGGQPPYLWPGLLMTVVYLVVVTLRGGAHPICRLPRLLGRGIAVAAGGILLAGIQLVPMVWSAREFPRPMPKGQYDYVTAGSFGWADFPRLLVPDSGSRDVLGLQYWETQGFVGTAAVLLALAAVLSGGWRSKRGKLAIALIVVGVLLMLGGNTPLYLLLAHIPPFSFLRVPARLVVLVSLGIGLLAAEAVQAAGSRVGGEGAGAAIRPAALVTAILALIAALLTGTHGIGAFEIGLALGSLLLVVGAWHVVGQRRHLVTCVALAATALQLGVLWSALNPTVPFSFWASTPHAAEVCASRTRHTGERILCLQPTGAVHPAPDTEPGGDWRNRLSANAAVLFGVPSAQVADAVLPGAALFADAQAAGKARDSVGLASFCDIIGVRWVTMPPQPLSDPWVQPDPALPELYENSGCVGPYYLCSQVIADAQGYPRPAPPGGPYELTPVACTELGPGHLLLEYDSSTDSNLFIMQGRWNGWMATLDGTPVPLQAAAPGYFMWLPAPAGHHRVELSFQPLDYDIGLAMTLVGLGIVAMLGLMAWIRRSRA